MLLKLKTLTAIILLSSLTVSCVKQKTNVISQEFPLSNFDYQLDDAPSFVGHLQVENAKANLGRFLFYDKSLSLNGNTSCASCHIQELGFGDGKAVSQGFNNQSTIKHSMSLVNVSAATAFFWDGRANELSKQVLMPIADHIEMGIDEEKLLIAKIEGSPMYRKHFKDVFKVQSISSNNVGEALAHFISSIVSYNTKFDQVTNQSSTFTTLEKEGANLFFGKFNCGSCHGGLNFNSTWGGTDFANIGLDKDVPHTNPNQAERFKVPTLRNIEVTGPYMHDGRFSSLEEVIEHYSSGMKMNQSIDWRLISFASQGGMKMTDSEKKALIAFMKTLTDHKMLADPRYSNPF